MSRLEQLIQQYCPDGVEYKPLGEVCDFRNGFAFKSNLFTDEGCPIIRITNISENNVDMSDLKYFHMEDYPKSDLSQFAIKKGDILVAMSGATTGKIGTYKGNITAYLNQRTGKFEPKESLNNRFLYHFLQTQVSNMYKMAGGGAQPNLSSNDLKSKIVIPVPPLPVQEEIVRILDSFTELQAELQAELQKRLQQYNYYRDNLLSFEGRTDVEWKKLGELGVFYGGLSGKTKDDFSNGNAKFISYKNVFYNLSLNVDTDERVKIVEGEKQNTIQYGDILFTGSSETPDECGMSSVLTQKTDEKLYLNSFCFGYRLHNPSLFCLDFLKHLFRSSELRKQIGKTASGTTRFNVSKKRFAEVSIPVPPLLVQKQIANILDKFYALTTDITAGLPAEIETRRKQYEYYRDQLLTFKQKA